MTATLPLVESSIANAVVAKPCAAVVDLLPPPPPPVGSSGGDEEWHKGGRRKLRNVLEQDRCKSSGEQERWRERCSMATTRLTWNNQQSVNTHYLLPYFIPLHSFFTPPHTTHTYINAQWMPAAASEIQKRWRRRRRRRRNCGTITRALPTPEAQKCHFWSEQWMGGWRGGKFWLPF